ncbi:MAG: MoxR family ATPase [Planctomycetes bacterium]|nr:MoxR family ATPase [Planctomycetota bacterium]
MTNDNINENTAAAQAFRARVAASVRRAVVGFDDVTELSLLALLCGGHALLEGVPGVAKTLFVRSFARALGLDFRRIQFTPDLMPSDVTGTLVFNPREGDFIFRKGPVFAQLLLCDEINRAPAKTQSALLEAMQERSVTTDGVTRTLPEPFLVFATQNPIEQEGTYPLPEAQLDRFLFQIEIGYPEPDVERAILMERHKFQDLDPARAGVEIVSSSAEIISLQKTLEEVVVAADLGDYVVRLLAATRNDGALMLGGSPRAGVAVLRAAKARAMLGGRMFATPDDVKKVWLPALRHRVLLDPRAEVEGTKTDAVLNSIADRVAAPR